MKMNDTVARIVEIMFQDVEMNEETAAIRDEVMNNCQEHYTDLVNSGMNEDDAIAAVIESLKGMEDVLAPYKRRVHHTSAEDDDEESVQREMIFTANEIHRIDLCLVNEDVTLEASDDACYHVLWNAEDAPLVQACVEEGVLKIDRRPGEAKVRKNDRVEIHFNDDNSNYVRFDGKNVQMGDGDGELNFKSFDGMFKSIGNTLKNVFTKNGVSIRIGFGDSGVTIQIPENAMPHVKLLTTSGDIDVQNVALTDLSITSTSGDIDVDFIEDEHLARAELRTTSGDIEASFFTENASVTSTSGDVEVEGRINSLTVNTISGDIDVRADVKNMAFKAISGDVDLQFDSDEIRDVRGSTISGDIDIDLPDGIGVIAINTSTRSGDVTTRHHTTGVGPTVGGSVSSMSGDITIH